MTIGCIERYRRTVGAFSLFESSVQSDGLPLSDAFRRHLSDLDVEDDIPSAAIPAWRRFLSDYLGIVDLAGVHLSDHCAAMGRLSGEDAARALATLSDVHRDARLGLAAVEESYATAMSDAALDRN